MTEVEIRPSALGFAKVSFTMLAREMAGLSLPEAHRFTDGVAGGGPSRLQFEDEETAILFVRRAVGLGAICIRRTVPPRGR